MTNYFKTTAAAAALMVLPFGAFAAHTDLASVSVSLNPNNYSNSYTVASNGAGVVFNFEISEDLRIPEFSLSASAPRGGVDTTMYEISKPAVGPSTFGILNLSTVGADIVPGTDYSAGDTFSVTFSEQVDTPISYTVSFATVVASVPVPAAGLLLLGALGGVGALRRRKKA